MRDTYRSVNFTITIIWLFFDFQVKVKSMRSCDDRFEKLNATVTELSQNQTAGDEVTTLKNETDAFIADWNNLLKQ